MKLILVAVALAGLSFVFGETPLKVRLINSLKDTTYDYEDPYPDGTCNSGETAIQVEGISGAFCAPECDADGGCPTNVPPNVTATPECILENESTGQKYCCLTCETRETTECGSATCQKIEAQIVKKLNLWDEEVGAYNGICTYSS